MHRIFGSKPQPKKEVAYTGPSLAQTSATMDTRVLTIDAKIAKCDEEIQEYMRNRGGRNANLGKAKAMQAMKRKKMLESQRNTMLNTQLNVDSVAMQQENLITTAQTAKALEQTQKVMSKQLEELDVDKIADVQDDLNDLMMDMEEVNEVMGRNYALDNIDEGELDAEFDAIEEEMKMEHFNEAMATGGKSGTGSVAAPSYLPTSMASGSSAQPAAPSYLPSAPEPSSADADLAALRSNFPELN